MQEQLRTCRARAESVFSRLALDELFFRFGPEPSPRLLADLGEPAVESNIHGDCNCEDWFDCNPIWPSVVCHIEPDLICVVRRRCGFIRQNPCIGLC